MQDTHNDDKKNIDVNNMKQKKNHLGISTVTSQCFIMGSKERMREKVRNGMTLSPKEDLA